jgi:hypothetical protein
MQLRGAAAALTAAVARVLGLPAESRRDIRVDLASVPDDRTVFWFGDFGLALVKGDGFFLALRCAESYRPDAPSGHLHDDNLAIELYADGRLGVCDPGVFVYTSLPEARNAYRGAAAHHAPRVAGWDAASIDPGLLFLCPSAIPARLLYAGKDGLAAELPGPNGAVLLRTIEIGSRGLIIRDGGEGGVLRPLSAPPAYCTGYGKQSTAVSDSRFFPHLSGSITGRREATNHPMAVT